MLVLREINRKLRTTFGIEFGSEGAPKSETFTLVAWAW